MGRQTRHQAVTLIMSAQRDIESIAVYGLFVKERMWDERSAVVFCDTDFTSVGFRWRVECELFSMAYGTLMFPFEFLVDNVHRTCYPDLRIRKLA